MKRTILLLLSACASALPAGIACAAGETYAIQNVQTGKNLRPRAAASSDRTDIVLYAHHAWKCMTWRIERVDENSVRLLNRYTAKSFEPSPSATLWQQPSKADDPVQRWELVANSDETWRIRLAGSNLYVTISSEETNTAVALRPRMETADQLWRLIPQDPWF